MFYLILISSFFLTVESGSAATSQILLCSQCQLSFSTEAFLQRHTEHFHTAPAAEEGEPRDYTTADPAASVVVLSIDPVESRTCGDCGKTFKQITHLKRHKLCVHSNKRPYCCQHCRRTFSQASGLIRHQVVHRKQWVFDVPNEISEKEVSLPESTDLFVSADPVVTDETKEMNVSEIHEEMDATKIESTSAGKADASQSNCSDCGKSFINELSLKKHKVTVHEKLRPYVCTLCQKCFGQYNDLNKHLRCHKREAKRKKTGNRLGKPNTMPFRCAECSVAFSSVDKLEQHISEAHSQGTTVEDLEDDAAPTDEEQSCDPDFIPEPSEAETCESIQNLPFQRPQRLGARSKISAITKLIAPKRRADACKKPLTGPAEQSCSGPEEPAAKNGKLIKCKWFSCNRCKRTYGSPGDLRAHKCPLRPHKCDQCGSTFIKSGFLKRHEQTVHQNAKSYSCDYCDKAFATSANLKQHQKSNTCMKYHCASELFSCSYCQFSFTIKSYLIKHIKRHHPVEFLSQCDSDNIHPLEEEEEEGEKEYKCPHCGKSCTNAKAFKSHRCFQQVKVLYLCTDCGKGFTNHYGLKQHQRIHTGEKPYSCPHCPKSFSYAGQLNVHLRTHTGEKPYLCTHCGESFRQSGDLKRHERKHTGVRPYSCPECCKSFSRPQSLKAHQMLHLGQRMFKCTQCGKSFSRNYHLRRHHQKMHL